MTRSVWRERDELTGEPRVVKRFDGSRAWRAHKEAEVMRSLEATGWGGRIPTAIDTHVVDDHDTTLLVMTVLPGTPLALTTGAAQWLDSLRAIGSLLAELHASASVSAHGRPGAVAEGFAPQRFGWLADE
ncbi:MAG: hypothetical protein QOG93_857, partial [Gaiellaceae bacterium]|nr:hypothetical protein [Gaiellaceae bacterium]